MTLLPTCISVPDQKLSLSFPSLAFSVCSFCLCQELSRYDLPPLPSISPVWDDRGLCYVLMSQALDQVWVPLWAGRAWVESSVPSQEKCTGLTARCTGSAVPAWMAHSMRTSSPQVSFPLCPRATCLANEQRTVPSALRQGSVCSSDIL